VSPVPHRIARCLLVCALLAAGASFAATPSPPAEPTASAAPPKQRSLPAKKKADAPVRWDRLDPGTIERASKGSAPKAPTFPAERP